MSYEVRRAQRLPEMPEGVGWDDRADWLANTDPPQLADEYRDMWNLLYAAYEEDTGLTAWDKSNPIVDRMYRMWAREYGDAVGMPEHAP